MAKIKTYKFESTYTIVTLMKNFSGCCYKDNYDERDDHIDFEN